MDISIINTFKSSIKKLKVIEVAAAVEVENENDPCLVEVLEAPVVTGVEIKTIADQKVGAIQGVEVEVETEVGVGVGVEVVQEARVS